MFPPHVATASRHTHGRANDRARFSAKRPCCLHHVHFSATRPAAYHHVQLSAKQPCYLQPCADLGRIKAAVRPKTAHGSFALTLHLLVGPTRPQPRAPRPPSAGIPSFLALLSASERETLQRASPFSTKCATVNATTLHKPGGRPQRRGHRGGHGHSPSQARRAHLSRIQQDAALLPAHVNPRKPPLRLRNAPASQHAHGTARRPCTQTNT